MEFKDRIKILREEQGISYTELGAEFGKTEAAIRSWEVGRTKPDADTLIKLAQRFKCTTDFLLGISEFKNQEQIISVNKDLETFSERLKKLPEEFRLNYLSSNIKLLSLIPKDASLNTLTSLNFGELIHLLETLGNIQDNLANAYSIKQEQGLDDKQKIEHFVSQYINKTSTQTFLEQYLKYIDKMVDHILDIRNAEDYMWYMDYTRSALSLDHSDYEDFDFGGE